MFNNTSYGVSADGKSVDFPGAFITKSFTLTNNRGQSVDIRKLIHGFTITEEIFSPVLAISIDIIDNVNLFEDYGLCGQEILELNIIKTDKSSSSERKINLRFVTKEYPSFSRDTESYDIQRYTMIGISEIGYHSTLTKISRSITGHTADNIKNIFVNDLSVSPDKFVITGEPSSNFSGVLPINTPIYNAKWLTKRTFDKGGSPFLIFQTINGKIQLSSVLSLVSDKTNPSYRTYVHRSEYREKPGTQAGFNEQALRILEISSDLKLDKIAQAKQGGFSSETQYIDIANKNITSRTFNHATEGNKEMSLGRGKTYSSEFGVIKNGQAVTLNDMSAARINYVYTNPSSYGFSSENSNSSLAESQHQAQSIMANLQNESHTIVVYGDLSLNAGRKINIDIPKAVSYYNQKEFRGKGGTKLNQKDSSVSGKYIVFSASHHFYEGVYTTELTIGRDSA
jgi:hypothetical protein